MTASSSGSARRVAARLAVAASLVVASAALAAPALAQDPAPPPGAPGGRGMGGGGARMNQMLFEGITLSDAQKARVDSVGAAFQQRAMAMPRPEPGTPPSEEQRAARMKLMEERMAALRGVLTADQAKTFDANVATMRSRMGAMGGMGGGRPPARR